MWHIGAARFADDADGLIANDSQDAFEDARPCRSPGADARLITSVGDDDLISEVLERFRRLGLSADSAQIDPATPTGTVDVTLAADGQSRFTIREGVAWDRIAIDPAGVGLAALRPRLESSWTRI